MAEKLNFQDLLDIIDILRSEDGCPWDKAQTHQSLSPHLLEEAYERVDAIEKKDMKNLCEELGDLLFQVGFHAKLAAEEDMFGMEDVTDGICRKMKYRHPHLFLGQSKDEVDSWEKRKQVEKGYGTISESIRAIPKGMPAFIRAEKILKKTKDYTLQQTPDELFSQIRENLQKLEMGKEPSEEIFGNLLMEIVQLSAFFKINPEIALTKSTEKFINRFECAEKDAFYSKTTFLETETGMHIQKFEDQKGSELTD